MDDVAYRGSRRRLCHSISAIGPKIPYTKAVKSRSLSPADKRQQIASLALQRHYQVLASFASRSFFLIGELLLGKLSETVVVQGNAPHDTSISGRPLCGLFPGLTAKPEATNRDHRSRHQRRFYKIPSSITLF